MLRACCCLAAGAIALAVAWTLAPAQPAAPDAPRAHDARLRVTLFAKSPDVVHPVGIAFDARGRLLVVESHTHFRPAGYKGPAKDRVLLVEDSDGDGKADRFTIFHEGTTATMAIAVHPDGSVYLATRNEVLRLRDTDGDGKADDVRRLLFLDTKASYPHNGLSGLCFDARGDLYVGMGENLGANYTLRAADGTTQAGGGDGGKIFWCTADGKKLRRIAIGFWNPFGVCTDIFGRLFAVDNDPDAMPPCRLLHVVEGADYGYQFRYGRSGRHPFQAWDGQILGTLPMMSGTGEAPCQVLSYESDGLPREYVGDLLVASWADHRLERYAVRPRGASVAAERKPFVKGGADFRPVGIAVAPDGSLFVSDWVLVDYTLHGKGAIWHVAAKTPAKTERPADPRRALASAHRPQREAAARTLAASAAGRAFLRKQLAAADVRVRAASLAALIVAGDDRLDLKAFAQAEAVTPLRARAVRALADRGDARPFLAKEQPAAVRIEAVRSLTAKADLPRLLALLDDDDPFLRHAAVQRLARSSVLLAIAGAPDEPRRRAGLLLAWRASGRPEGVQRLRGFLTDADETVRFLAVKWVSDARLTEHRDAVVKLQKDRNLSVRLFIACATALARLDGRAVNEAQLAEYFFERLRDKQMPTELRVRALQGIPVTTKALTPDVLAGLLAESEPALQVEAARALAALPTPKRFPVLKAALRNARLPSSVRAQALVGLTDQAAEMLDEMLALAGGDDAALRDEALRALTGTKLAPKQRDALEVVARRRPEAAPLVARVLGRPFTVGRPPVADTDAWLKRLDGPADAEAGRRLFGHPKLAGCVRCHRAEGRGQVVGPDLSVAGRNERRHNVESLLRPSAVVAPNYQAWLIETTDGKVRTGLLARTYLDEDTYLDAKGDLFRVNTRDVVESRPVAQSLMPDGLADQLTDRELRDLLAYLTALR